MRALVQRILRGSVAVEGEIVGRVDRPGLLLLVGATHDDGPGDVDWVVRKAAGLRVLAGEQGAVEAGAPLLVVSQFTLYGDARKGRRPTWQAAAPADVGEPLVDAVADGLRRLGLEVATGRFGADMRLDVVLDGPMTVWLESPRP